MDSLSWIAIGFIIIGFVVLAFATKNMKSKIHQQSSTPSIIWGIAAAFVWGMISIFLIVGG